LIRNTANDLTHAYASVDLFVIAGHNTFKNLSTLGDISHYTNGRVFYYPKFTVNSCGTKFDSEFNSVLTAKVAWEAVGRVRTSSGYS